MALPNIFSKEVCDSIIQRLNQIQPDSKPNWGTMNASQMMAHCCVTYEMAFENIHKQPPAIVRFFLRKFVKPMIVNEKKYGKNLKTAKEFIIADDKEFDKEKTRLIAYINKAKDLGPEYFEGKPSLIFGKLTSVEWNNMFIKHLEHHLEQFDA
ncbi:DUF1569 domain-containing protein [Sandaracinomonas limnophila]|uniref:DUF1569 domain-containing protein n=1 Tax=Sandaracinomonas limnophila TaxID=1862386 RepID=A0A437PRD0_9BACT|nr:DUF1569 domain-containing protein [Sandaracinomonas limnophila]RVU24791.1 DUF1569 domain-containing protein [Sandaracinomonas limnophila]